MRIADLAPQQRPRERLLSLGASALTDSELLAIVLRTGVTGKSAIDLGEELLHHFGSMQALLAATPSELQSFHGLGDAKRAVLLALIGIERRRVGSISRNPQHLASPKAVRSFLQQLLQGQRVECFVGLFLDHQNQLIACETIASGTLDRVHVYPREVVKLALRHNAAAVIFAHNHPAGCAEPSALDTSLTRRLKEVMACIEVSLLDHLIVAQDEVWSFHEHGLC